MSWPNKPKGGPGLFFLCCLLLALITLVFVGGNLFIIIFRGLQSLPASIRQAETLFAVGLSVRSACISTDSSLSISANALSSLYRHV